MGKRKTILRKIGFLMLGVAVLGYGFGADAVDKLRNGSGKARSDVIIIDTLAAFGDLERPKVEFLHDLHTDALAKKNKDCTVCHLQGYTVIPETLNVAIQRVDHQAPMFKRIKDEGRKEVMTIYHDNCIKCHTDMMEEGDKAGPVVCGGCHKQKPEHELARTPMELDKSLHFRHSKTLEKKCELCHHEYDAKENKLFYAKEKEGSCRYCHREKPETPEQMKVSKMSLASHLSCIGCHKQKLAANLKAGPLKCAGCHDALERAKIEKVPVAEIARMERKQPDIVFVKTLRKEDTPALTRMNAVSFDHKAHETYNDTCRVCHHESLQSCNSCHSLSGSKEGKFVKLEQSMHQIGTDKSCMGCHTVKQQDKNCAGCHSFMEKTRKKDDQSCMPCHNLILTETADPAAMDPDTAKALAEQVLQARTPVVGTYAEEDIPEKVVMKDFVDKYEQVEFPHRKIVKTLLTNMKDNKLAGFFHQDKGTICQGCHHNTPVSAKPPKCGHCHGKPFDDQNLFRPGRVAAYHQQCMGCHSEMKMEKPMGCTECHKERKK